MAQTVFSILLGLALLIPSDSLASEAPLQLKLDEYQLVGKARLTKFFFKVYDSRLYSLDGQYRDGQRPVALDITYLRSIKAEDLADATRDEWQAIGVDFKETWIDQVKQLWPDVSAETRLTMLLDREGRHGFFHNGEWLGAIDDPDFGPAFLAIWLSPKTTHPALRRELIGE